VRLMHTVASNSVICADSVTFDRSSANPIMQST
jgi:hypothetical protein